MSEAIDWGDLGFPTPTDLSDPYDEDDYCEFCGNGRPKYHAPWCQWADAAEALLSALSWR